MKPSVLVVLGVVAVLGTPASALAQKDGTAATPAATPPAPVQATAPSKSPAASPTPAVAIASAPTGATAAPAGQRYTWCSAITAPPLQRGS